MPAMGQPYRGWPDTASLGSSRDAVSGSRKRSVRVRLRALFIVRSSPVAQASRSLLTKWSQLAGSCSEPAIGALAAVAGEIGAIVKCCGFGNEE